MMQSNVSKGAAGMLGAIVLTLAFTANAQAKPSRVAWVYAGGNGSFTLTNSPGQWVENTHLGTTYTFTEIQRTPDYVELYDASRGFSIRLYANACFIRHAGTNGRFDLLYRGAWSQF